MAKTTYSLTAFNRDKAKGYSLVVMCKSDYSASEINNYDENFKGAGIAKYQSVSGKFEFSTNGEIFAFNQYGVSADAPSTGWKLVMANIIEEIYTSGNTAKASEQGSFTRSQDGTIGDVTVADADKNILIDSLAPRDQFAVRILESIINKMEENPTEISSSAISHYCQSAYQWAANMMTAAANARAVFTDQTKTDVTTPAEVGTLENNTEKLLNNIIAALERTDETSSSTVPAYWSKAGYSNVTGAHTDAVAQTLPKEGGGQYETTTEAEADGWTWHSEVAATYSERIINPKLNKILEDLQETVSEKKYIRVILKDLDTIANKLDALDTTLSNGLSAIETAISNLELSPTINNYIEVPENNEGE